MENLISSCDGKTILLQVDISENASLLMQNEIQSTHWNHNQTTLFTTHVWINQDCMESIVIISDDLNHTKTVVYTFMSFLYNHLTTRYPTIETINTFSDGAASQFKQEHLFSNLYTWEQNTQTKIWNFFATLHQTGAVDGLGGTVKHSVWRFVKAGGNAHLDAMSYS